MAGSDNKISNIIGTAIPNWLLKQLQTRSAKGLQLQRDNANLEYLSNKTAWVRLVSSVNLEAQEDIRYFSDLIGYPLSNPDSLAKDFVLQGGTSVYTKIQNGATSYTPRQGFKETYSMLGEKEVNKYGYRPMPGLTRVSIETQGKLGSIRMATIEFKVWDKDQLDVMDALYFKLGFTMYLEWGNTYYYPTTLTGDGALSSTELFSLDPFSNGLVKEQIQLHIGEKRRESEGNYDGMLGMVVNFSFSYNQDGGYDCTLKMAGLGTLAESIKINHPSNLPDILQQQVNDLNNIYKKIEAVKEATVKAEQAKKDSEIKAKEDEAKKKLLNYDSLIADLDPKNASSNATGTFSDTISNSTFAKYAVSPSDLKTNSTSAESYADWKKYDYATDDAIYLKKYGLAFNKNTINDDIDSITLNYDYIKNNVFSNQSPDQLVSDMARFGDTFLQYGQLYFSKNSYYASDKYKTGLYPQTFEIKIDFSQNNGVKYNNDSKSNIAKHVFEFLTTGEINYGSYKMLLDISKKVVLNTRQSQLLPDDRKSPDGWVGGSYKITQIINGESSPSYDRANRTDIGLSGYYLTLHYNLTIPTTTSKDGTKNVGGTLVDSVDKSDGTTTLPVYVKITDSALIDKILANRKLEITAQYFDYLKNINSQNTNAETTTADSKPAQGSDPSQTSPSSNTQSSLECILRTIQVYSLVDAIKKANNALDIGLVPQKVDLTTSLASQIFSAGIFKSFIQNLIDDKIDASVTIQRFAKYGFNASLLAGRESVDMLPPVNYKELLTSYVVPYKINQNLQDGSQLNHPVYIQFGLLLMILNDTCLLYDKKIGATDNTSTTPIMYLDFNPETNFCLSNPSQLSVDGLSFLIPFEGQFSDYVKLFNPAVLNSSNEILATKENKAVTKLFNPASSKDIFLNKIPKFKFTNSGDSTDAHRGKVMNVLVSIDYLFGIIKQYLSQDASNSLYLKALIDQILSDMNKTLGSFNAFRLYYDDSANTLQVVDDQLVPGKTNETLISKTGTTDLPLYGVASIAKTLELKTDLSTRVNNLLAISANADQKKQASNSVDASPVGAINNFYYDRYINNRTGLTDEKTPANNDTEKESAIKFNSNVEQFYGTDKPSTENVNHATNYFIQRMATNKNESFPTRAAAMIPVSVNFSTDGISGFGITQGFTIPQQLLPYTYSARAVKVDKNGKQELDALHKVGFITTGINHIIENNQWTTSIKGSMIYLKNRSDFNGELNKSQDKGGVAVPGAGDAIDIIGGTGTSSSKGSKSARGTGNATNNATSTSAYLFGTSKSFGDSVSQKAHGARDASQKGQWQSENAWDLFVPAYTPVYALFDGTISGINFYEVVPYIWGYRFTLNGSKTNSWYTHLDSVVAKDGQSVKKGDLLGYVGQPPRPDYAWDTHLHIALKDGVLSTYLDSTGKLL
jgi:hypothetical protein